ncbi:phospholipase C, phosphocholine-specific [Acinetobacter rudis]|uniref:phosphocholine-specific phospholipase C n=1 Tax=Acinetobacter rudis TaxID=632955 RepID=UPI0028104A13|nr:phospholipase C, phosphocholine-specific [Acinetobacter rudis]MDQ8954067.1 phospholipase C, phosphocholine-specific [Acinetobacter rudis]
MITRRQLFSNSIKTGLGAAALATFPASIQRALAIPANNKTGSIQDVEHVVILMQENRSFDHYFGTMKGVRGFSDRITIPMPQQRSVWEQLRADGQVLTPYHLNGEKHNAQRADGTPHSWGDSQAAWDHGRMSQWPKHKTDTSMGYFTPAEIPYQFALADAFTICDAYHCSMHTGTDANRSFHLTGTNGATATGTAFVNNEWDAIDGKAENTNIGYTWKTYAERLEQAGVSWICYQNMPDEWGDNMLGAFRNFKKANIASGFPVSSGGAPNSPYSETGQTLPYHAYDHATDNAKNPLYKGIANTLPGNKPEEYLDAFKRDIKEGRLPQVSWLNAPSIYCEHPGPSSPVQGAWFIQEIIDALTAVPEVWSKTVVLINFDENDGYFDHVPSPSAPSKQGSGYAGKFTLSEEAMQAEYFVHSKPEGSHWQPTPDGRVYGPGPRVPLFVVSPWSRGGWVNSQVFDHTSVLMFLEQRFGVKEENISAYRRAVCGDLSSAFNFKTPNELPFPQLDGKINRDAADQLRHQQENLPAVPLPQEVKLPRQQAGIRPSRALPYELHTSARCQADGTVRLIFSNTGKQAAVFHVYDCLNLSAIPRRYVVEADKQLDDVWSTIVKDAGEYDLWVLGPNGFHRHFKGQTKSLALTQVNPEIKVCYDVANGDVYVEVLNNGQHDTQITIQAIAYFNQSPLQLKLAAGQTIKQHWHLADVGCWYDFIVKSDHDPKYARRFAGRVETGEHSVSDPALAYISL